VARERADLAEGAGVGDGGDALADGPPSLRVLPGDGVRAPELQRPPAPVLDAADLPLSPHPSVKQT